MDIGVSNMKTDYIKAIRELVYLTLDKEVLSALKDGTLEQKEMFPALCLVTRQFSKAQKILNKYKIVI